MTVVRVLTFELGSPVESDTRELFSLGSPSNTEYSGKPESLCINGTVTTCQDQQMFALLFAPSIQR